MMRIRFGKSGIARHALVLLIPTLWMADFPARGDDALLADRTAFGELRQVVASEKGGIMGNVVGMIGFFGELQPPQWLVLTDGGKDSTSYREYVIRDGEIRAERKVRRHKGQDLPRTAIAMTSLQIDSDEASRIASDLAERYGVDFGSLHYQLRCRDGEEEPVWVVSLIGKYQVSLGSHYISAQTGEVLESRWYVPPPQKADPERIEMTSAERRPRQVEPIPFRTVTE